MAAMVPIALTIAGSDPSGGAGIQADLKTFHQHGVYGTSAVTLVTVQNTRGVSAVRVLEPALVSAQIDAIAEDVPPRAAKTGALGSAEVVEIVAERASGFDFPLVVDPVMVSKHGAPLLDEAARSAMEKHLLPLATLLTPNAHEAAALLGREVRTLAEARDAARALGDRGPASVLVKGGHIEGDPVDVLLHEGTLQQLEAPRIDTDQTHGAGCAYSAAIAAHLARGWAMPDAVQRAKTWLTEALRTAPHVGAGTGPVNHHAPVSG